MGTQGRVSQKTDSDARRRWKWPQYKHPNVQFKKATASGDTITAESVYSTPGASAAPTGVSAKVVERFENGLSSGTRQRRADGMVGSAGANVTM